MSTNNNIVIDGMLVRRAAERRAVAASAECRRGTRREKVQLRDLSIHGARLQTIAPLREGVSIWLQFGALRPIEAVIVWAAGYEAGCTFAAPLHPAMFDALTA